MNKVIIFLILPFSAIFNIFSYALGRVHTYVHK